MNTAIRSLRMAARIVQFHDAARTSETVLPILMEGVQKQLEIPGGQVWQITGQASEIEGETNAVDFMLCAELLQGTAFNVSLELDLGLLDWRREDYLLMPGAVYDGNRFASRKIAYSPKLTDPADIGPEVPPIITDVPRLQVDAERSRIEQLAGDLACPAVGVYSGRQSLWVFTEAEVPHGATGLAFHEDFASDPPGSIRISSPGVREKVRYSLCTTDTPSSDRGANLNQGDRLQVSVKLFWQEAASLQALFGRYAELLRRIPFKRQTVYSAPLSACWTIQENKYNRQNWVEQYGYYSVGLRENFLQNWQIGWTGGMISTYPLWIAGNSETKRRVERSFDYLFPNGISPSGFFYDCGEYGKWYGGDIRREHTKNWHLIRKGGDGLFFIMKQFFVMQNEGLQLPAHWTEGARIVADAFLKLWNKNGQLGQFVHSETGEIMVGGSASGAIVPAALVLCSQFYEEPEYAEAAAKIASYLYEHSTRRGITNGGPGDALQNPDSESAFALTNSYMALYEHTGAKQWLFRAEQAARQYATWVVPYDFRFPEDSLFGRLNMRTAGAVYANTQNKHGSPGICTDSGLALFKLFRATGDPFYLELLAITVRNLPQYLSRTDRPIGTLEPGWMNERVNLSDWNEPVGEIFHGSTWAEIACMLAFVELPGLYVQPDSGLVAVFDQIEARLIREPSAGKAMLEITNPTAFAAEVKVWAESSNTVRLPLREGYLKDAERLHLSPGETRIIQVDDRKI